MIKIKTKQANEYLPDYSVAPGQTLLEVIENLSMTKKDLALRTGLTEQIIDDIIKGVQPINFEMANEFESVTGVKARLWNNLERQYRALIAKFVI